MIITFVYSLIYGRNLVNSSLHCFSVLDMLETLWPVLPTTCQPHPFPTSIKFYKPAHCGLFLVFFFSRSNLIFILSWNTADLQYCVSFRCVYIYIYICIYICIYIYKLNIYLYIYIHSVSDSRQDEKITDVTSGMQN